MMRPRHSNDVRIMFMNICFPKKSVGILDAPFAGRLERLDVEMQMRPAAAASFLSEDADLLASFDLFARLNGVVDRLEMRITIEPAVFIQHVNVIVVSVRLVEWRIRVSLHRFAARRNDQAVASGNHIDQTFAAADVVPGMIINFARRTISAIDIRGFVADLRLRGEPALSRGVSELAQLKPGRIRGPESQWRIFLQPPRIFERIAIEIVTFRDRAIDLHTSKVHRQAIIAGIERNFSSIYLHRHSRQTNCRTYGVTRFIHFEQLNVYLFSVGNVDLRSFASVQINDAKERKSSRRRHFSGQRVQQRVQCEPTRQRECGVTHAMVLSDCTDFANAIRLDYCAGAMFPIRRNCSGPDKSTSRPTNVGYPTGSIFPTT